MIYRFNKEKFKKSASRNVKEKLKYLLDDIENLVVDFSEGEYGTLVVDLYEVEHELYPVLKDWCSIEEQLKIV